VLAGLALDYVEVVGHRGERRRTGLRTRLGKRPCVWYRYRIERRLGAGWITESAEASEECFLLRDETGECVVDPQGAEIIPCRQRRWREFGQRYHEQWIAPAEPLYVLGSLHRCPRRWTRPRTSAPTCRLCLGSGSAIARNCCAASTATATASSPRTNGSRRGDAQAAIEREYAARRSLGPLNVVRKPRDGRRYLISVYEPAQLARQFLLWAWLHFALFITGLVLIFKLG
jgi:hypothetical protein